MNNIKQRARMLCSLNILAEFFHIGFASIVYQTSFEQNYHCQTLQFLQVVTALQVAHDVPTGSNLRISRHKDEMIKVHKNVRLNKETGRRSWRLCGNSSLNSSAKYRSAKKADYDGSKNAFPPFLKRRLSSPLPSLHRGKT